MSDAGYWHTVLVDEDVFPLEVVLKATYWLSGRFDVQLGRNAERRAISIALAKLHGPLTPTEAHELEVRLRRDLIDFRTRAIVEQETRMIRELLVAKAFDDEGRAAVPDTADPRQNQAAQGA